MRSAWLRNAAAVLVFLLPALGCLAQAQISITLTGPVQDVDVPDGEDFATEVLGKPWDMTLFRDIGVDYNYYNPYAVGGEWVGEGNGVVPYVYPLNPGWLLPGVYTNYFHHYDAGTTFGPRNPINASKFRHLSMRMRLDAAFRDWITIWWADQPLQWPSPFMNFFDGYFTVTQSWAPLMQPWGSGYRIYDRDLTTANWAEELDSTLALPPNKVGTTWGGTVYGLQITPTGSKPLSRGSYVTFDWIRLYDPNSSPVVDISWASAGYNYDGYYSMQLWLDSDSQGYDGDLYSDPVLDDGEFSLKTASLPPGDYYAYLRLVRHENSALTEIALSGYSARIRVGQPPTVTIQAPSYTSGADYATTELLNPWDFSDGTDVESTYDITSISYASGRMSAYADLHPGALCDAQMVMNMRRNGALVPIDPKKYRYLTFRQKASPGNTINILERMQKGWGTRLAWMKNDMSADGTYTKPVQTLEGWHSYSIDLWDIQFKESGPNAAGVAQAGWYPLSSVNYLRFDPLEPEYKVQFWLDDIKLCAMNRPSMLGVYNLRWTTADADSQSVNVTFHYGTRDANGNFVVGGRISQLDQAPGPGNLMWNTAGVPDGEYYVRAVVNDGVHSNTTISQVPIVIPGTQGANPGAIPVSGDYNGDGLFDLAVWHQSTGNWYIRPLGNLPPIVFGTNWGSSGMIPVSGDYDGDGVWDLAVYDPNSGNWFILSVSNKLICFGQNWGGPGLEPVPGDYNNDGMWDLAVYHAASGYWYIRSLGPVNDGNLPIAFGQNWGGPGFEPVTGDFNGDGFFDLAIYGTATGDWYIRSLGNLSAPPITFGQNWGGSGLTPVPGDFNNDEWSDLAVYTLSSGIWYIRSLGNLKAPPISFGQSWGAAGFIPVWGDFNGDGFYDLAVFGEATGIWYIRSLGNLKAPPITFGESWGW